MSGKKRSSVITPPPKPDFLVFDGSASPEESVVVTYHSPHTDSLNAIKQLVRKGAPSISPQERKAQRAKARFSIRLPRPLLDRIDRAASDREVHTPVNTWIIEAIHAQLKKEGF